jgi:hypothetical protein
VVVAEINILPEAMEMEAKTAERITLENCILILELVSC